MTDAVTKKVITMGTLYHYHDTLNETKIEPLEERVTNVATDQDIYEAMFSGQAQVAQGSASIGVGSAGIQNMVDTIFA